VGSFDASVLYLEVTSASLLSLHQQLIHELGISIDDQAACFEGSRFIPHLTLMRWSEAPSASAPFSAFMAKAEGSFTEPFVFQAPDVVVFHKPAGGSYRPLERIPLG
jgi:2'-5' RNA ligase